MGMFTPAKRKEARLVTEQLTAGFVALQAFWALANAGVLAAMAEAPIVPAQFAQRANMSSQVLTALVEYLAAQGLLEETAGSYALAAPGRQLMEHAATLELVRGHQGVLFMLEHLLGQLKTYGHGVERRTHIVAKAQGQRRYGEIFPAIERLVHKARARVALDVGCDAEDLLLFIAKKQPRLTGLGLSETESLAHLANEAFAREKLAQRVRAAACPFADFQLQPLAALQRADFPAAVWQRVDCVIACDAFGEISARPEGITRFMKKLVEAFPRAAIIVAMPCANDAFLAQTGGPELDLLLRLTQRTLMPEEQWETVFIRAGLEVSQRVRLHTDGFTVWTLAAK